MTDRAAPLGSVSVDLDDLWAYEASFGRPETAQSLWPLALPRCLALLQQLDLRATLFVVGRDAADPAKAALLRAAVAAGHEIGNHSLAHDVALAGWTAERRGADLRGAHERIADAAGVEPRGFRAPSFRLSAGLLETIQDLGYAYDSSAFHNRLAALARRWQARRHLAAGEGGDGADGTDDGHGQSEPWPLQGLRWSLPRGPLLELTVTSLPLLRLPVHGTYLLHLAGHAPLAADALASATGWACRRAAVPWQLLLHATDFIGSDDGLPVHHLPAMRLGWAHKRRLLQRWLGGLGRGFRVRTLAEQAEALRADPLLPLRPASLLAA